MKKCQLDLDVVVPIRRHCLKDVVDAPYVIGLWCRVAQEPLVQAIMNINMTITRAHATKILQRWFCISLRNGIAVEGMTRRHFEGVTLDMQAEEMSPSEAETWADDDAVMRWVVQFTGAGPEGNLFQGNVDVSTLTLLCSSLR